jgi:hypothetical protein
LAIDTDGSTSDRLTLLRLMMVVELTEYRDFPKKNY